MIALPVGADDYYDFLPGTENAPGDIWVGLPTFGVLPIPAAAGIVITPACDLSNHKVESVTYLPIVGVRDFVSSASVLPELKSATIGQLAAAGLSAVDPWSDGPARPIVADLDAAISLATERLASVSLSAKERVATNRCKDGLSAIRAICANDRACDCRPLIRSAIGDKQFAEMARRIVRNALRPDIHFLPSDGQRADWSGMPDHGVALFRYPLSLPIEVIELAQEVTDAEWSSRLTALAQVFACGSAISARPMKRLRLTARFTSDLLTRMIGMYGRLGSPDFTPAAIERMTNELVA